MRYVLYIALTLAIISCDEPYELDLEQAPTKIVIEGLVTDNEKLNSVKVTRSTDFYSSGKTPRVTSAFVSVTDDLGNVTNFVHNPNNHADSAGIYLPEGIFVGAIGRTYTLLVVADGQSYQATDRLESVIPIDSLKYRVSEDEADDPAEEGEIYEVLMFAREPQDQQNFYLFKFYKNDTIDFANDTDIYYSDDELLAEKIDGVPAPVYYAKGDTARVEAYSISRTAYVFYNDLWSLLNNDSGGMFGPIPSSPRTNISNGALGFFQVSAVSTASIKVE